MSSSEDHRRQFAALASELAALCAEAVDDDRLGDLPDDSLGQVLGSVVRAMAAKAQATGTAPPPFTGNSGVSVTDVAITATAMMDSVGLAPFELGAWQSMSGIGRAPSTDNG